MIARLQDTAPDNHFCVTDLFKDSTEQEAAENVADYFTRMSDTFTPLEDIPPDLSPTGPHLTQSNCHMNK